MKAAVAQAVFAVSEREVGLKCIAFVGCAALFGEPVQQGLFAPELMQRRSVARNVEQNQVADGVVYTQQVGGRVTVHIQQPGPHPRFAAGRAVAAQHRGGSFQAACLPGQSPASVSEAAFGDLLVAGGDEVDFCTDAVVVQVSIPVAVEHRLVMLVQVQLPDKGLKGLGVQWNMGAGVVLLLVAMPEQAVVDAIR
ncbi:hypothetical protein D3C73_1145430 [compost metagenome]